MKNRTKIVCTIGPSSWDPKVLKKMIEAGMNVARINAAFSDVAELDRVSKLIRSISTEVALMLDIKGNDVRCNDFGEPIKIKKGDKLIVGSGESDQIFPKNYTNLYKDLEPGAKVFFDDGKVKAEVIEIKNKKIHLKILEGEILKPGKSMNTPGTFLNIPAVTKQDKEQIEFAIKDNWDFVAASYVQEASDAKEVKKYLKGSKIQLIAKIEEEMGVTNLDEILEVVDGIMVARGDMAVEMPFEKLPQLQKMMIKKCNEVSKPVITATQVVESMTENPMPTRAEISDIANAVYDGTDAIMTSGETTVGKYPVQTIEVIAKVAGEAENSTFNLKINHQIVNSENTIADAFANAAYEFNQNTKIDKVIVMSETGVLARSLARHNIKPEIIAIVDDHTTKRQLALTKNVKAYFIDKKYKDVNDTMKSISEFLIDKKIVNKKDKILLLGRASDTSFYPNLFEYIDLAE